GPPGGRRCEQVLCKSVDRAPGRLAAGAEHRAEAMPAVREKQASAGTSARPSPDAVEPRGAAPAARRVRDASAAAALKAGRRPVAALMAALERPASQGLPRRRTAGSRAWAPAARRAPEWPDFSA